MTYPKNPATVPPVKVWVQLWKYTVSLTAPLGFGVSPGNPIPIDVRVRNDFGRYIPNVTVKSKIWIGSSFVTVQPASVITDSNGEARFWISAITGLIFDPEEYRVDFTIGSGAQPNERAVATGQAFFVWN